MSGTVVGRAQWIVGRAMAMAFLLACHSCCRQPVSTYRASIDRRGVHRRRCLLGGCCRHSAKRRAGHHQAQSYIGVGCHLDVGRCCVSVRPQHSTVPRAKTVQDGCAKTHPPVTRRMTASQPRPPLSACRAHLQPAPAVAATQNGGRYFGSTWRHQDSNSCQADRTQAAPAGSWSPARDSSDSEWGPACGISILAPAGFPS